MLIMKNSQVHNNCDETKRMIEELGAGIKRIFEKKYEVISQTQEELTVTKQQLESHQEKVSHWFMFKY